MVNASQNIQIQRTPSIETRHNRMRRLSEVHGDPREGEEEFPEDATVIDVTAKVDPEIAELEDGDDNVFDFDGDDDADDVLDVSKVVTGHAGTAPNETQWVGVLLLVRCAGSFCPSRPKRSAPVQPEGLYQTAEWVERKANSCLLVSDERGHVGRRSDLSAVELVLAMSCVPRRSTSARMLSV
eukprot:5665734-Pleurochrysis_carterae.AAC.1